MAEKVNINQASARQIREIKGVGEGVAEAIVRWRDEHGDFRDWEDLYLVPGVNDLTVHNLKQETTL